MIKRLLLSLATISLFATAGVFVSASPGLAMACDYSGGQVDCFGWTFDYEMSSASVTPTGLTLNDLDFNGESMMYQAHFAALPVRYDNDQCGPYVDLFSTVTNSAPTGVRSDTFTQDGVNWLELGAHYQIGSYVLYTAFYFSDEGEMQMRIFARGLQCNVHHIHYPMFVIDADVEGPTTVGQDGQPNHGVGDEIFFNDGSGWQQQTTETDNQAGLVGHDFIVRDPISTKTVSVNYDDGIFTPPSGGTFDPAAASRNRIYTRQSNGPAELAWPGANAGQAFLTSSGYNNGEWGYNNSESITDPVIVVRGYLDHDVGGNLPDDWHTSGISVKFIDDPIAPPATPTPEPTTTPTPTATEVPATPVPPTPEPATPTPTATQVPGTPEPTPTQVPPTATPVPPTPEPTATQVPPTPEPTATQVPPTPVPTATQVPPTPEPTATPVPPPTPEPTATVPPTPAPTATQVPPTPVPPTATPTPTATLVPEPTATPLPGNVLSPGVPVTGLAGAQGAELRYTFDVPPEATEYTVEMTGDGDADLYTILDQEATLSNWECRPYLDRTSVESCTRAVPPSGQVNILIRGYRSFSNVALVATYEAAVEPTPVPPTATPVPPTPEPTATQVPPTPVPPTATPVPPTPTPQPTATPTPTPEPTATPVPPTPTPQPTATPTPTPEPTATPVPPTPTPQPTATPTPTPEPTATPVPPTPVPPTPTPAPPGDDVLVDGVAVTGLSGATGDTFRFTFDVPPTATSYTVEMTGTGDADLYTRMGGVAQLGQYDCRPYLSSSNETCTASVPPSGELSVFINGYRPFSGVSITATFDETPVSNDNELSSGQVVTDLSGARREQTFYTIVVPAGTSQLVVELDNNTGDADLYTRAGIAPTTSQFDCRPYRGGTSDETCTINNPAPGVHHIMVRGWTAYSGASLTATVS